MVMTSGFDTDATAFDTPPNTIALIMLEVANCGF